MVVFATTRRAGHPQRRRRGPLPTTPGLGAQTIPLRVPSRAIAAPHTAADRPPARLGVGPAAALPRRRIVSPARPFPPPPGRAASLLRFFPPARCPPAA